MIFAAAIAPSAKRRNRLSTTAQPHLRKRNSSTEHGPMLIHAILPASRVNGPGLRTVLFVQGCSGLGCKNCWNPQTHPFIGDDIPVTSVFNQLLQHASREGLSGVTISGGEPMQQAEDLAVLLQGLRDAQPGISIGMFTGYSPRELSDGAIWTTGGGDRAKRIELWHSIRNRLDFAVMGRYNHLQPSMD